MLTGKTRSSGPGLPGRRNDFKRQRKGVMLQPSPQTQLPSVFPDQV